MRVHIHTVCMQTHAMHRHTQRVTRHAQAHTRVSGMQCRAHAPLPADHPHPKWPTPMAPTHQEASQPSLLLTVGEAWAGAPALSASSVPSIKHLTHVGLRPLRIKAEEIIITAVLCIEGACVAT